MNTFLNRVQRTSSTFSTAALVAAVVVGIIAWMQLWASGLYSLPASAGNIETRLSWRTTRRFGGDTRRPRENARFSFDLDANLEPLFNWNTKQVFVYLTVDYAGKGEHGADVVNSVTIWDKILHTQNSANLHLKRERSKYSVWDVTPSWDERQANLTLRWSVQPRVGFLVQGSALASQFVFPSSDEKLDGQS